MQAFLILDHQNQILSLKPPLFWTVPKKILPSFVGKMEGSRNTLYFHFNGGVNQGIFFCQL